VNFVWEKISPESNRNIWRKLWMRWSRSFRKRNQ